MTGLSHLHAAISCAASQHGVIARWQALDLGMSASAVMRRIRSGQWRSLRPGVYLALPESADQYTDTVSAVLAVKRDGLACGASAAWLHGFRGFEQPGVPEVLTRRRDAPDVPNAIVRTSCHPDPRADLVTGIATTSVARTAVDVAARVTHEAYLELVSDLLRRRATTPRALIAVVNQLGRPAGAVKVRETVDFIGRRGLTDSVLEDETVRLISDAGLPPPVIGYEVRDDRGVVTARVDLAYPELRIAIEVDGLRFHATPGEKAYDDRRQNALVLAGWIVLRFSARDIRGHANRVLASIRGAIAARTGSSIHGDAAF